VSDPRGMLESTSSRTSGNWFQPTWGRLLFAGFVASLGFVLPQEIPLEWYPLNNPGEDINLLELACAADKDGEVQIFYDTGRGFNEYESIRIPLSPTIVPFTYTFPLPDAPIVGLRLDPLSLGGTLHIQQFRIINRAGVELRRFARDQLAGAHDIAEFPPTGNGWKLTSTATAADPQVVIDLGSPILPVGMNHRNLQRCVLSTGYLTLMLCLLLGIVQMIAGFPKGMHALFSSVAFMTTLALLFAATGNRGLIKNSIRFAAFPASSPGLERFLEMDVTSSNPTLAQLFWDTGQGFSEAESHRVDLESHPYSQILRFPLPTKIARSLRFDPSTSEDHLHILGIRVTDQGRRTHAVIPPESLLSENEIAQRTLLPAGLRIHTAVKGHDPMMLFSREALSVINQTLVTTP
jgi:hypothetical protein